MRKASGRWSKIGPATGDMSPLSCYERWGAGVETQKLVLLPAICLHCLVIYFKSVDILSVLHREFLTLVSGLMVFFNEIAALLSHNFFWI